MTPDQIAEDARTLLAEIDSDIPDVAKLAVVRRCEALLVERLASSVAAKRAELQAIESALAGRVTSVAAPVDPRAAVAIREDVHQMLTRAPLTAGQIAKELDRKTADGSAALAWLSRHGKARTVTGTRGWVAFEAVPVAADGEAAQ